jgi:hypothetical protein
VIEKPAMFASISSTEGVAIGVWIIQRWPKGSIMSNVRAP